MPLIAETAPNNLVILRNSSTGCSISQHPSDYHLLIQQLAVVAPRRSGVHRLAFAADLASENVYVFLWDRLGSSEQRSSIVDLRNLVKFDCCESCLLYVCAWCGSIAATIWTGW